MSLGQGLASKYYSGFNPLVVGGCAIWLDAADPSTMTLSGSSVSQWRDKSGNNNNVVSGGTAPTYNSASNAIDFNGNGYLINTTFTLSLANRSVFIVCKQNASSTTGFEGFLVFGNSNVIDYDSTNAIVYNGRGSNSILDVGFSVFFNYKFNNFGDYRLNYLTSATPTPFAIYNDVFSNPNGTLYVNGSNVTSDSIGGSIGTSTAFFLGARNAFGNGVYGFFLNGSIYEVIVYNFAVSTSQRQQIEGYLARKWGLQNNLPSTHPYYRILPVTRPFQPLDIDGCSLWLDAADPSTITLSGSNVTVWADKSGTNNNAVQGTRFGALGPTVTSSNSLRFTRVAGTSTQYLVTQTGRQTTSAVTYFVVIMPLNDNVTGTMFDLRKTSDGQALLNVNGQIIAARGSTSALQSFSYTYPSGVSVIVAQANTNLFAAFGNGTSIGSSTATLDMPAADAGFTTIGAATEINYGVNATYATQINNTRSSEISEVIMYNGYLSTTDRQRVEGYLAWKWGLRASLPSAHPFRTMLPPTTSFNPRQISNCALWLDAADPSTVTLSGVNITQLRDKSPNSYVISNANGFTYNQTKFQVTYPSFYNGSSVTGRNLGSNTSVSLSQPITFFTVCSIIDTVAGGYIFDSTNAANRVAFTAFLGGRPTMFAGVELFNTQSNAFVSPAIHSGIFNTTNSALYLNGTLNVTGNAGAQTEAGLTVGARFNNEQPWTGHICEVLLYSGVLTTFQRQQIEGYLARKWNLQNNLPSTHPYRKISPI